MRLAYQAPLCALFFLALFTLDSKALNRVEHRGVYRPAANVTSTYTQPQQKQWQQQQQQQPYGQQQQPMYATTRNPNQQQWNNNAAGGGGNYNQWNNANGGGVPGARSTYNQSANNPWQQRYNTTTGQSLGGQAAPNWNMQQRPLQNQGHLYPQLPAPLATGNRQPLPTPSRFNNQWNQTRLPGQQYPGGVVPNNPSNNWWPSQSQNKTWNVQTTTPLPYMRPNSGMGAQNANWFNQTRGVSANTGWNTPSGTGILPNGGATNPNYQPAGQASWAGWGANGGQQNNPTGTGWGSNAPQNNPSTGGWGSTSGQNGVPANNWQGNTAAGGHNGLNNNWQNSGQNSGTNSGGSGGAQLAPLGGNTMTTGGVGGGGQTYNPAAGSNNGGVQLAPIGGGAGAQPGWHSASAQQNPNAWNHGSSGSAQLAPLTPLSYGAGGGGGGGANAVNPNRVNGGGGGSNPYATMFN